MTMTTTVTLDFEGPASCVDCQRIGVPVCDHIGFNPPAWVGMEGQTVNVPGLDQAFMHTVHSVTVSPDRKTVTLVLDTERPPVLELARHLSTLTRWEAKAFVRAVHHETGDVLCEGKYDAFLRAGQEVYVNGEAHVVHSVEHPNRNEYGTCGDKPDVQVAAVRPVEHPSIQFPPQAVSNVEP